MSTRPEWMPKTTHPFRRGWYHTRTDEGDVQWRAWGRGAWWKQLKGGWIEWFTGDGEAMRYQWKRGTRKPISLNSNQLPPIE